MDSIITEAVLHLDQADSEPFDIRMTVSPGRIEIQKNSEVLADWSPREALVTSRDGMLIIYAEDQRLFVDTGLRDTVVDVFYRDSREPLSNATETQATSESIRPKARLGAQDTQLGGWLRLVALAAFVLPFMTVSCFGEHVVTVTGAQLALGLSADVNESFADFEDPTGQLGGAGVEEVEVEVLVLLAGVLLTAAAIFSFISRPGLIPAALSFLALMSLVSWWFDLSGQVGQVAVLGFVVQARVGLWVVGAATLGSVIADIWVPPIQGEASSGPLPVRS